jgi:hypothetical protein
MWRELPTTEGDKVYRIQTNDSKVHRRMYQRNGFSLVCEALNTNLWVYATEFISLRNAKRTFERITRQKIKYDSVEGVYFTYSVPIVDSYSESEV